MKKGFTLVELSIVLVIIGLLVGGILVGQSLIDTARINRLVSDLQQYEIAIVQFKQKFKKFPGDSAAFTPAGNASSLLNNTNTCTGVYSNNEFTQFWSHLSQAQMLKTTYPMFSPSQAGWGWNSCGGTHTTADYLSGKITPYVKIDASINASYVSGVNSDRYSILISYISGSATTPNFTFYTIPTDILALENKLTQSDASNSNGFKSHYGKSTCMNASSGSVNCGATNAIYGGGYYFLQNN